jgi:hypothetical protein
VIPRLAPALLSLGCVLAASPSAEAQATRDFPVIVYRQAYSGREAPETLVEPFGGVHVRGDEPAEWVLARGLDFYVEHSAGRDDLHLDRDRADEAARRQGFLDTREARFLERRPCLTDAATRERLFAALDRTLAARGGRFGLGYSLGDEVSLTAGGAPDEVCCSPTCKAAWRRWLAERGLLERASASGCDDLAHVGTDAALESLGARTDEQRALLEFWLLRREFHHDVVVLLLGELAARVRAKRANAPVGLMGLAGETAFGNVAVDRALGFLDFVECYRTFDASELAFTLREPRQALYATVFPSVRAPDAWAWATSEHFARGGDGTVVWCDRELERSPALHASLARATTVVRDVRAAFRGYRPSPRGVAMLRSSRNLAWCWLEDARDDGATWPKRMASWQDDHGRFETAERQWLELCEDCGLMPGVLPIERIDAATVTRFPCLVACALELVTDAELARLERYLAAGGRLIADDSFAAYDEHAAARAIAARRAWREARGGRVLSPPEGVADYLPLRRTSVRDAWLGRLALCGVESAPFTPRAKGRELAWLVTWVAGAEATSGGTGGTIGVALPKFPGLGRQGGLGPRAPAPELEALEVDATPRDGLAVEWIWPPGQDGARTLAAGDPLVVRLTPTAH